MFVKIDEIVINTNNIVAFARINDNLTGLTTTDGKTIRVERKFEEVERIIKELENTK